MQDVLPVACGLLGYTHTFMQDPAFSADATWLPILQRLVDLRYLDEMLSPRPLKTYWYVGGPIIQA